MILEEIAKKRNLCKCAVELRFQIKDANGLYDDTLYIVPIPRKVITFWINMLNVNIEYV